MILVTGGTGFIGRHVVARLAEGGKPVRVAARGSRKAGLPDGVEQVTADIVSGEGLAEAMAGADRVAHLVAVITEKGGQRFDAVIRGGTANVVSEAEKAGVKKLVYVSAIGAAQDPKYPYWHAKWQAEQAVAASNLNYTILRPSLVFGPEDDFFNRLQRLIRHAPIVPVAGDGKTRFQPIWVEDVVTCVVACLNEGVHDREIVEIGGSEYYTYNEIIDLIRRKVGTRKPTVHVPLWAMRPGARVLQAVLPSPPVTTDQLAMLSKDNATALDAVPKAFGFTPMSLRDGLGRPQGPAGSDTA
ncbi:MAG: complex I NDUFA9 subunit family protein [Dehalococcoidia bacterium]|nr:complex I NDUFA9 subunit family protein [Dehalococcoidia bacterium]